jgi:hypothetical protein
MWRTGLGILLLGAAVACFMASRYAADTTKFYVLINLGCAGLVAAAATQVPGALKPVWRSMNLFLIRWLMSRLVRKAHTASLGLPHVEFNSGSSLEGCSKIESRG